MEHATNYVGAWTSIVILIITFVLFLTEWTPLVATAIMVPVVLVIIGVLPYKVAFKDFANKWTLIFMFMFMMGEALFRTGFTDLICVPIQYGYNYMFPSNHTGNDCRSWIQH